MYDILLSDMKIKYRNNRLPINEQIYVVTDYAAKIPVKDILAKYGISRGTLYSILKRQANADEYTKEALLQTVKGITK